MYAIVDLWTLLEGNVANQPADVFIFRLWYRAVHIEILEPDDDGEEVLQESFPDFRSKSRIELTRHALELIDKFARSPSTSLRELRGAVREREQLSKLGDLS
jgi:hypothetical protein